MIVIHIDSQKDTSFLTKCYEGIDAKVFVNPTREEVEKVLTENPNEKVMMLGHGSSYGLFSFDWKGDVIDRRNAHLLKDRECIGIWCYASDFARKEGLKGYFTSMFISNEGESQTFRHNATEKEVFDEVAIFAERVNTLIKNETPLDEWVGILQGQADYTKSFVKFNYSAMEYLDGTQEVVADDRSWWSGNVRQLDIEEFGFDTEGDDMMDLCFEEYCAENGIEGYWAREMAYPIFKAGWNARKDYENGFNA